jgi:hypothetical protein
MQATLSPIHTQVLVAGGGAAGIAAAVSAARNGADTTLVEYNGFLGGISATLTWLGFHDNRYRQVVRGFAAECVAALQEQGDASPYVFDPKCSSLVSLNNHAWKVLAFDLAERAGVRVMLHTHVVDALREGDRIAGVVVEHKAGRQEIRAGVTIDCTGDGDVAARGGADWEKGRTPDGLVQAPTLVFRVGGVETAAFIRACQDPSNNYREWLAPYPDLFRKTVARIAQQPIFVTGGFAGLIEKAKRAGDLRDVPQSRLIGVKTHVPDEFLVVMTRVLGLDPTDAGSLSDAYARVYRQIPELMRFFRKYMPGWRDTSVREIAPMIGVRESRRIMGDYVLSLDDVVEGRRFPDGVAMGGYHVDIHNPSGSWVLSRDVKAYQIPLRALIARGVDGLMMAGKCFSGTHEGVASTRVIPICMAQGQAAGAAAAMAATRRCGVRDVPVSALQSLLTGQGVELGETLGEPDWELVERIGVLPDAAVAKEAADDDSAVYRSQETAWVR